MLAKEFYYIYMQEKRNVYLYGASITGSGIDKLLKKLGITITAFSDGNKDKWGTYFDGYEIVPIHDIPKDSYVIITASNSHIRKIEYSLRKDNGIHNIYFFENESLLVKTNVFINTYDIEKTEMFENIYQNIRLTYKKIEPYFIWADRMGEMLLRLKVWKTNEEVKKDDVYRVIIPYLRGGAKRVANAKILEIMSRGINIVYGKNEELWSYIISQHFFELDFSNACKYDADDTLDCCIYSALPMYKKVNECDIVFTQNDEIEGMAKARELKISLEKDIVCIFGRDSRYLDVQVLEDQNKWEYQKFHDMDIRKFELLVRYLAEEGIQAVRVGSISNANIDNENVIDITNANHDDLLDLYINSKCIRWIGSESGACFIPQMFGKKAAYINFTQILNIYPIITFCIDDTSLYIPKLYYSKDENRYLSLKEMCLLNLTETPPNLYEEEYSVLMIENTPEDILELYKECELRENNKWEYGEEEIYLQSTYRNILEQICQKYPIAPKRLLYLETEKCIHPLKIGTTFLKKYNFLLE